MSSFLTKKQVFLDLIQLQKMKVIRRYDELDGFKKALKTDFLSQLLASSSGKNVQFSDFIFFSL